MTDTSPPWLHENPQEAVSVSGALSGGSTPYSGLYGEAPPEKGAFFKLAVYQRVGKIVILVYDFKGHKIHCKVEEMVAKAKYMKGWQILAEATMQNT